MKSILEIGTWNGENSKKMIQAAQSVNNSKDVVYYGFDLWDDMDKDTFDYEVAKWPPSHREVEEKLNSTSATIHLYKGNTLQTLPNFIKDNPDIDIDLIFMDGGHSFETSQSDWDNISKIVKENTIVLIDDYLVYPDGTEPPWGCSETVDNIDRSIWNVNMLPHGDFMRGKTNYIVEVTKK
ncbi:class I SAM-dependent methyltransferase [Candidatus Woesearchaeota archaeon]|nr:class I SAM-dependent methyltransferase [Candidatus Neomarinimicrobiota bacterium]MBT4209011.1 class I SAM-dependent methyltransferase [Candidatus Woesearchaeota archaeon]